MGARGASDRRACENNLRTVWGALQTYGDQHQGAFPMVEAEGPRSAAGAFVPVLREAGTLTGATLVSCPARPEHPAADVALADLEAAYDRGGEEFARAARDAAGGYGYTLGYRGDGATLVGLRADDPDTLPIVADARVGGGNSLNHGGAGQNVLYIGGNVRWCVRRTVGQDGDDIYVNKFNLLRAGEGRSDTVLGPGDARPLGE